MNEMQDKSKAQRHYEAMATAAADAARIAAASTPHGRIAAKLADVLADMERQVQWIDDLGFDAIASLRRVIEYWDNTYSITGPSAHLPEHQQ